MLVRELAVRRQADYGTGYNLTNLKLFRKFYFEYPRLADGQKGYALRILSSTGLELPTDNKIGGHNTHFLPRAGVIGLELRG